MAALSGIAEFTPEERDFTRLSLSQRPVPPISMFDTVVFQDGAVASRHGTAKLFEDHEILCIYPPQKKEQIGEADDMRFSLLGDAPPNPAFAFQSRFGGWVIPQQSTRGCVAAAAMMLRKDHNCPINFSDLRTLNGRPISTLKRLLTEVNLIPLERTARNVNELAIFIQTNGPAVVTLKGDAFGFHVVIVDSIGSSVLLREPYHGWHMRVTTEAFNEDLSSYDAVVQITNP